MNRSHKKTQWSCSHCGKYLTTKQGQQKHERVHTGEKPYACDTCGKSFSDQGYLMSHKKIHTGEKPFGCSLCAKTFRTRPELAVHVRAHTGEKPYACSDPGCDFRSSNQAGVSAHQRRVHLGIKPHVCLVCENAFASTAELTLHDRTHTGEKPYACDTCGMRFAGSSDLRNHVRTHIGEKPFECSSCGKWFTKKTSLRGHAKACHTPGGSARHTCEVCQKSLAGVSMKGHMKTHETDRERLIPCNICTKSFYTKGELTTHLKLHGPKKHACGLCGISFGRGDYLMQHVSIHTRE